jgi:hypothetical protein
MTIMIIPFILSVYRQKPFCSCHCAWRALLLPLRVAGASFATARGGGKKPFRLVSCTFLRAGATSCTHNECRWIAHVGWSCLGCERYMLVAARTPEI